MTLVYAVNEAADRVSEQVFGGLQCQPCQGTSVLERQAALCWSGT